MRWIKFLLLIVGLSMFGAIPPSAGSTCSAECKGCNDQSPTCTASCNGSTHCQDGECGGLYVGCCCIGSGFPPRFTCLSVPCGVLPPQYLTESGDDGEAWGLLTYDLGQDGTVQVLGSPYASSTAFAQGLVKEEVPSELPNLEGVLERLGPREPDKTPEAEEWPSSRLFLNPSYGVPAPGMDRDQVDRMRELLTARIPKGVDGNGQFALRLGNRRSEVLYSTNPELSAALAGHVEEVLDQEANERAARLVDVFLVEARDGVVISLLHTSYVPGR